MKHARALLLFCDSGVALVEFALILPVLLMMLIGTLELSRFAIIGQKLDKAASAMADFVTQSDSVSVADLDIYAEAVPEIMQPFTFSGSIVFSSVAFFNQPQPPCEGQDVGCITWQHNELGGDGSLIGAPGGNAALPGDYTVIQGQNVITAEAFMDYTPLLDITGTLIPALAPQTLYRVAVYKPRQGLLTTLE